MSSPTPDDPKPQGEAPKGPQNPAEIRDAGLFGDVIFSYSRAQAIADGVLVDISETAKEAGFSISVAVTRAVWDSYVAVPKGVVAQDEAGRLWDILWMCRAAIARLNQDGPQILFQLHVRNDNRRPRPVTLKAVCGPGDADEPVLTIMRPDED
jgi:hypothetical protein